VGQHRGVAALELEAHQRRQERADLGHHAALVVDGPPAGTAK
jgi:hypothetical protein